MALNNKKLTTKLDTNKHFSCISIFGDKSVNLENQIEIMKSSRITGEVIDKLNLTTEIFSEGKINLDILKEELGEWINDEKDKYKMISFLKMLEKFGVIRI